MRRSRFPLVLFCTALVFALAGCGGGDSHGSDLDAPVAEVSAGPPVSDADYTTLVSSVATDLTAAIDQLRASSPDALPDDVAMAEDRIEAAKDRLTEITPPVALADGHGALISGLADITRQLGSGLSDYQSGALCTPSAVADSWGNLPGTDQVRDAVAALGPAGAPLAAILPPPGPLDRRLDTGTVVTDPGTGPNELTVDNGTATDAVVTLAQDTHAVGTIYVARHTTAVLPGIPTGTYRIFISHGADWDPVARGFSRSCTFAEFVLDGTEPIGFSVAPKYWEGFEITLHDTDTPNATIPAIDRAQFPVQ